MNTANIDFTNLLTKDGEMFVLHILREAREKHGDKWKEQIKKDFPMLSWLCDLAANYTAENAFIEVFKYVQSQFQSDTFGRIAAETLLNLNKEKVFQLHRVLKAEIERPRF